MIIKFFSEEKDIDYQKVVGGKCSLSDCSGVTIVYFEWKIKLQKVIYHRNAIF